MNPVKLDVGESLTIEVHGVTFAVEVQGLDFQYGESRTLRDHTGTVVGMIRSGPASMQIDLTVTGMTEQRGSVFGSTGLCVIDEKKEEPLPTESRNRKLRNIDLQNETQSLKLAE